MELATAVDVNDVVRFSMEGEETYSVPEKELVKTLLSLLRGCKQCKRSAYADAASVDVPIGCHGLTHQLLVCNVDAIPRCVCCW